MEFLVNRNYGSFPVGETANGEYVSVYSETGNTINVKYGGLIIMEEVELDSGRLTLLTNNPSYRRTFQDSWTYTSDDATMSIYVRDNLAFIVVDECGQPSLIKKRIGQPEIKTSRASSNVFQLSMHGHRD